MVSLEPTLVGEEDHEASAQRLASLREKPRPSPVTTVTRRDACAVGAWRRRPGRRARPAPSPRTPGCSCALAGRGRGPRAVRPGSSSPPRPSLLTPPGLAVSPSAPGTVPRDLHIADRWHFLAALCMAGPPTGLVMTSLGSRDSPPPRQFPLVTCSHVDAGSGHTWPGPSFSVHTCSLHCVPPPQP